MSGGNGEWEMCMVCDDSGHCTKKFERSENDPRFADGADAGECDPNSDSSCSVPDDEESDSDVAIPTVESNQDPADYEVVAEYTFDGDDIIGTYYAPTPADDEDGNPTTDFVVAQPDGQVVETAQETPGSTTLADTFIDPPSWDTGHFATDVAVTGDNAGQTIPTEAGSGMDVETDQGAPPKEIGDPVLLGSGALSITEVDFVFPGPVRDLGFYRFYNSQSGRRGILGSNWSHNFDVRLEPINAVTAPSWASPYCKSRGPLANCMVLRDGRGGSTIFYRDPGNSGQQVFVPQAGSTDTLVKLDNGWIIRDAEGGRRIFNTFGYLVEDRDRFGNGFRIEYEPVPYFTLYDRYCRLKSSSAWRNQPGFDARICDVMAYWFGDTALPDIVSDGLSPLRSDPVAGQSIPEFVLPEDSGYPLISSGIEGLYFQSEALRDLRRTDWLAWQDWAELSRVREAMQALMAVDIIPELNTGSHKLRPVKVIDDVGRTLEFEYFEEVDTYDLDSVLKYGLLKRVHGPAWTSVGYAYDRPDSSDYPARLADQFLVNVMRTDPISAKLYPAPPERQIDYEYAFDEIDGFPYQQVFDSYNEYFSSFLGCSYWNSLGMVYKLRTETAGICGGSTGGGTIGDGDFERSPGNPCVHATSQTDQLLAQVAGKMIRQSETGLTKLETDYQLDPHSKDFGRVIVQRHGGMQESVGGNYPEATFIYTAVKDIAGVAVENLETIAALFSMESVGDPDCDLATDPRCWAESPPEIDMPTCGDDYAYDVVDCNNGRMPQALANLPGHSGGPQYVERDSIYAGEITQSPVSCEQIGAAQLGDPLHNGLVATFDVDSSQGKAYLKYFQNGRRRSEEDALRICRWVSSTDRVGNTTHYGLNFRGQALVEATMAPGASDVVRLLRKFNADGNPIYETAPHTTAVPPRYEVREYETFDDIDSDVLPILQPGFWSRRNNMTRDATLISGGALPAESSSGTVGIKGMVTTASYEPLFNQPRRIQSGVVLASGEDKFIEETIIDYDYQEFSWSTDEEQNPVATTLMKLIGYGFEYAHEQIGNGSDPQWSLSEDYGDETGFLRDVQFPVHFYGADLNGDGEQGFPHDHNHFVNSVAGVPVRVSRRSLTTDEPDRITRFAHSAHGQISQIVLPSGARTSLYYYRRTDDDDYEGAFGPDQVAPSPQAYSLSYTGFLAAITTEGWEHIDEGELHELVSTLADRRCVAFPGPFEYLFTQSEGCGTNPAQKLSELGMPSAAIDSLLESKTSTITMTYNEAGYIDARFIDNIGEWIDRDVDGRPIVEEFQNGLKIHTFYSDDARPVEWKAMAGGEILWHRFAAYDGVGNRVVTAQALEEDGCLALFYGLSEPVIHPLDLALVDVDAYPNCRVEKIMRDAEDRPIMRMQTDGATEFYTYDDLKRLKRRETAGDRPYQVSSVLLLEEYLYDDFLPYDPPIKRVLDPISQDPLFEEWTRDELGRTLAHRTLRGENWEMDFDLRAQVVARRFDDNDHIPGAVSEETQVTYNGFGEVIETVRNGEFITQLKRLADGRPYALFQTGKAPRFMTTDGFGEVLWSGDSEGNSQVFLHDFRRQQNIGLTIEVPAAGVEHELLVTSYLDALDINFLPEKRMRFSPGAQPRVTYIGRDVLGRIVDILGEDGSKSKVRFNLASDTTERCESTDNGEICTQFENDRQGRPLSLLDPSGTETLFEYSDFGELMVRSRDVTGGGAPYERFEYDNFGRIAKIIDGDGDFRAFQYDSDTGDLIADQANTGGQILYQYDPLGRLAQATRISPLDNNSNFRSNTGFTRSVSTVNSFTYDHLGRVVAEGIEIGGIDMGSIERFFAFKYGGTAVTTNLPYRTENRIYDGLGRLSQIESADMGVEIDLDWVGARFAGREQGQGPFREDRRRGAFGELEQIEFTGIDVDLIGQQPGRNWEDDYCNVGHYQGGWDPAKCSEPLMAIDFVRDAAGRITDRTTTYGFPNGHIRNGSEFETTGFSYTARGFLADYEAFGSLLTGSFTDGHIYLRDADLGSTNHLNATGGSSTIWSGLRTPDGRLMNALTANDSWSFDYDSDGKMAEFGHFDLEYDRWKNLVAVHDTDSAQDFAESYIYDFAGRMVGVVSPLGHIDMWLYEGKNPVERWSASNQGSAGSAQLLDEYTFGQNPNQLLAARTSKSKGTLFFPLTDERQSIIGIFNEDRVVLEEYAGYNPDGRIRIRDNQDAVVCSEREMHEAPCHFDDLPHFGFTGAYRSTVTGLTKMGARWYSAQIGQFISPDPLWYIDSFDLYAYAGFDPVNRWDPTGLASAGLGNIFGPNEPRSSFADQFRSDRSEQFRGMTRDRGGSPGSGLGRGLPRGSGGGPGGDRNDSDWTMPLDWNRPFRALENAIGAAADTNRRITESSIQGHQSTLEESDEPSIISFYAQYRLAQLRGWQLLTPQTGDEAMFDAAMAPLGGAIVGFRFLRFLPSRAAPLAPAARLFAGRADWAELSGMLTEAARGKGNFTIGAATREQAAVMGEAWVGHGFSVASDGRTMLSADGLRQYRPPTWKPREQAYRANFEARPPDVRQWQSNAHLDIID